MKSCYWCEHCVVKLRVEYGHIKYYYANGLVARCKHNLWLNETDGKVKTLTKAGLKDIVKALEGSKYMAYARRCPVHENIGVGIK